MELGMENSALQLETERHSQKQLMEACRKFLTIRKTVQRALQNRQSNLTTLCSVIHGSDDGAGSVVYVLDEKGEFQVLRSDTLEQLPEILQTKIFSVQKSASKETGSPTTFRIKAFPSAELRLESVNDATKLACFVNRLGWVHVVGAIGEVDAKGKPEGITFVARTPGPSPKSADDRSKNQLTGLFFPVSQTVLDSVSTLEKIQIFKHHQTMR